MAHILFFVRPAIWRYPRAAPDAKASGLTDLPIWLPDTQDKTVAIASIAAFLAAAPLAAVADDFAPPAQEAPASALAQFQAQTQSALGGDSLTAPDTKVADPNALPEGNTWRYSEFIRAVMGGKVERVRFAKDGASLQLTAVDGRRAQVTLPNDPELVDILAKNGVDISVSEGDQQGNYASLFGNLLFPLLAFGGLFFLFRRAQGGEGGGGFGGMGGGGPMDFGKSKSKFQEIPETGVTFVDVAGVDGAKLELQEVVDFLKNPDKYTQLGAKIPKGCLLVGPPGTGKTMAAKRLARYSGLDYALMTGGDVAPLGADAVTRIHELFDWASTSRRGLLLFIDEADAFLAKRSGGVAASETAPGVRAALNALLYRTGELSRDVVLVVATNRPEDLDAAVLDRMDEALEFGLPDVEARQRMVRLYFDKLIARGEDAAHVLIRRAAAQGQHIVQGDEFRATHQHLAGGSTVQLAAQQRRKHGAPKLSRRAVHDPRRRTPLLATTLAQLSSGGVLGMIALTVVLMLRVEVEL